jgi:hypothetical protein
VMNLKQDTQHICYKPHQTWLVLRFGLYHNRILQDDMPCTQTLLLPMTQTLEGMGPRLAARNIVFVQAPSQEQVL